MMVIVLALLKMGVLEDAQRSGIGWRGRGEGGVKKTISPKISHPYPTMMAVILTRKEDLKNI